MAANFEIKLPEEIPILSRFSGANTSEPWPGFPFVYRIFRGSKENRFERIGLKGLNSTAASLNMTRPNIPYWDILEHVAFDPNISSLITTTTLEKLLRDAAIQHVKVTPEELYVVKIDVLQLR